MKRLKKSRAQNSKKYEIYIGNKIDIYQTLQKPKLPNFIYGCKKSKATELQNQENFGLSFWILCYNSYKFNRIATCQPNDS